MTIAESGLMRMARGAGLERLAWALRRLHCPVASDALVLEVGSGGNPYPRANVLLDAFEATRQRHWAPLVADRPTVLGVVERLPFRDKAFDFVIASHVLEHSVDPGLFLGELQRVARAGYIEVPDAFMERLNPYRDHRLEIALRDGALRIRKKSDWRTDAELVELYERSAKRWIAGQLIPRHPFDFHVRYYWEERIEYSVLNEDTNAGWDPPAGQSHEMRGASGVRAALLALVRRSLSQTRRNRAIALAPLLRCPTCGTDRIEFAQSEPACAACGEHYEARDGILIMYPKNFARRSG